MEIIDEQLNIYDVEALADYMSKMLKGVPFVVLGITDDTVSGMVNNSRFAIHYDRGKRMDLINFGNNEDFERIKKIISPIMWYKDESARKDVIGPIFSFSFSDGARVITWDYVTPELAVRDIVKRSLKNKDEYKNIEVYLNGFDLEEYKENLKYGKNTSYFTDDELKMVERMSEMEFYLALRTMMEAKFKLEKMRKRGVENPDDLEEGVDALDYRIAYMLQKIKQFGVKVPEPSFDFNSYTIDIVAWIEWWGDSFDEMMKKHPDILPFKTDTRGLKPEGNYTDYIQKIREKGAPE